MRRAECRGHSRLRPMLLVVIIAIMMTVLMAGTASAADRWSDISDSEWLSVYGITADEAWTVAEGYEDGTFRPSLPIVRAQFAKMAVDGFDFATSNPPVPTFPDVGTDHFFYIWVEGGVDAGIIYGYLDGYFRPDNNIMRQQANSMIAPLPGAEGDRGYRANHWRRRHVPVPGCMVRR